MKVAVCGSGLLAETARTCLAEAGTTVTDKIPDADVIWLAYDTPLLDGQGVPSVVMGWADKALTEASPGQLVLVSSQLPVGSVRKMSDKYTHLKFFCSPENLRTGSAVENFKNPGRVIIGTPDYPNEVIASIFAPFCKNLFWCTIESAEMVKHAINAHLAAQIALTNELGRVAIKHGANPAAVEYALRSDERFSNKGYYHYGKGGLGAHLSRDVAYLLEMSPGAHMAYGIQCANDAWEASREQ